MIALNKLLTFPSASDPVRAITGATIAAQIVEALNLTVTGAGKAPLNIQFGAYGGMQSFFGLANLTQANPDFYGVSNPLPMIILPFTKSLTQTPI
jgi:hypothetical protein